MNRTYSILIVPWRETRMRRLVISRRSIRVLICTVVSLLGLSGWLLGNFLWTKFERDEKKILRAQFKAKVNTLKANYNDEVVALKTQAKAQREKLLRLQERTKASQQLLANLKGLRKKIEASLPRNRRSSFNGKQTVEELETSLASLQGELEGLIRSIPSEWPIRGWVSSRFGRRRSPWTGKPEFHNGTDIANRRGTPVRAPADGVVEFVGKSAGKGRYIVLDHGQGLTTHYGHLSKIYVKQGDRVHKNQKIANVGNTGRSTNPHLHYEVRVNDIPIDPRRHLLKQNPPSS
ncbi:MAG: peptidoglycan DD-metalloendopeptidase family protein [Candidatus Binatia bacterium]